MSQNQSCIGCHASASCSLRRPDPAVLSCLHPQRWKRFYCYECLRQEGTGGKVQGRGEYVLVKDVQQGVCRWGGGWGGHGTTSKKSAQNKNLQEKPIDAVADFILRIFSSLVPSYLLFPTPLLTYPPPTCPLCSPTEDFGFLEGVGCLQCHN